MSASELSHLQLTKLNRMLAAAAARPFYASTLAGVRLPLRSLDDLQQIPFLTKQQIADSSTGATTEKSKDRKQSTGSTRQSAGIFDLPIEHYARLHQTSGTSGYPITVLDTPDDWAWWLRCWEHVLDAAKVTSADIAFMAFSFGPFIGFWTANDALIERGCLVVPGGGVSTETRLRMIDQHRCTIVCCTPTYALHLAASAKQIGFDLGASSVKRLIVAGEPGGSIPSVRNRIESAWGATVIDHAGASEIGAWGVGTPDGKGLQVIETEFIAEIRIFDSDAESGSDTVTPSRPANEDEPGELVLTNLGRLGGPAIRYRTGDMVRGRRNHDYASPFLFLDGGVLGRSDDMLVVRGVNIFPSSIEAIIREVQPTDEFRITLLKDHEMDQMTIDLEGSPEQATQVADLIRQRLAMRCQVQAISRGSLPTFEAKAKRVIDKR